ncbi:AMP-binding protein [Robertmurraya sp.]|jgi:3,4-dihydroxybenzoate---[aryl-carrier protein] ligase|uniref:AMP-binding protein n=1 Tax=Robertmurraya sp. TaxID=2837525 RepID=UPI003703FC98
MFYVNDQYYSIDDLEKQFCVFDNIPVLRDSENLRIAVCISDVFVMLSLYFYIRNKGGSFVPINPSQPEDGATRIAVGTGSHILIYQEIKTPIVISENTNEAEGVLVQMSSGTTGAPKCIERTWKSIEEELNNYVSLLAFNHQTTSIVACPVSHSYGLISGVLACIRRGAEPVILTNLNPRYIWKKLKDHPRHILYGAPFLLYSMALMSNGEDKMDYVISSGTTLPAEWLRLLKRVSNKVLQQYGCSEVGCVSLHKSVNESKEVGYPLSHLSVHAGTKENPEEIIINLSNKSIYTKDLGYIENGILCFLTRIDDMINVSGLNVYPQEVEDVLMAEPRIEEAVVYKKSNSFSGERVCAQYVSSEPLLEDELREWCQKFLAPYQIPMEFNSVNKIEKLPNGKISRKILGGVLI